MEVNRRKRNSFRCPFVSGSLVLAILVADVPRKVVASVALLQMIASGAVETGRCAVKSLRAHCRPMSCFTISTGVEGNIRISSSQVAITAAVSHGQGSRVRLSNFRRGLGWVSRLLSVDVDGKQGCRIQAAVLS